MNRYDKLKKLLVPQRVLSSMSYDHGSSFFKFKRCGEYDGSYVLPEQILNYPLEVLSYGIGSDEHGCSFEQSLNSNKNQIYMYDGSIEELPIDDVIQGAFRPEYVSSHNFKLHLDECGMNSKDMNILKMDIEGNEYEWGTERNFSLAAKYFAAFCIEVHSLIEYVPAGWVVEPQLLAAKEDPVLVREFFERMNEDFILWHMHGNNHSPCYEGLPDSLELTYINKKIGKAIGPTLEPFPIIGLDKPNYNAREDYVLDWWL